MSQSRRLLLNNQENGKVTRKYLVFEKPFWRKKYRGFGSFSYKFPFIEMTDLSPLDEKRGVLVFVFVI